MTSDLAVRARGLTRSYGTRRVLDDLDLDVGRGECFALLGPNGAGKTTTVDLVAGFRSRDGGTLDVLGADPDTADRRWRARIGVVGQDENAGDALSVRETLDHFACYHARPRPTEELLEAVGLADRAGQRVPTLSGGQRRRLDVALGVQGRPELLLLDEPTTGFDPAARHQFWSLVDGLRAGGTTILLTTHYLDEAAHLADRVGVMSGGRLVEVAPPAELGGLLTLGATVSWRADGTGHEVVTTTPSEVLRRVLADTTGELEALTVLRPSLEDVYLTLLDQGTPAERTPAERTATERTSAERTPAQGASR